MMSPDILYREELQVLVALLESSIAHPPADLQPHGASAQLILLAKITRMRDGAPGMLAS